MGSLYVAFLIIPYLILFLFLALVWRQNINLTNKLDRCREQNLQMSIEESTESKKMTLEFLKDEKHKEYLIELLIKLKNKLDEKDI